MKRQFVTRWMDVDTQFREISRERVAYLLRAARSRGDVIHVISDSGYCIGELRISVRRNYHESLAGIDR